MAEFINKEKLISRIEFELLRWGESEYDALQIIGDIEDFPAAEDVVKVTRCKNCKYCFDAIMGGLWCEHPDHIMPLGSNPDDFCSYGEPKEETK